MNVEWRATWFDEDRDCKWVERALPVGRYTLAVRVPILGVAPVETSATNSLDRIMTRSVNFFERRTPLNDLLWEATSRWSASVRPSSI